MPSPRDIEQALTRVNDQQSLLQLFGETLEWPNLDRAKKLEDLAYGWSADELRACDLDKQVLDGQILQLQLQPNQSWGIFVVEFAREKVYRTALRKVLRGLIPSRQRSSNLPAWKHENLLFICVTKDYKQFTFAHFRGEKAQQARLATFGWEQGDRHVRTVCEYNLKALAWPDDTRDADAWLKQWAGAFDVEAVTKRFFEEYRQVFENVESKVRGVPAGEQRRLYVQRLFNRLMFLYFIQRKGWLTFEGKKNYLRALFDAADAADEDFLNERLYWTFFYGLNTPGEDAKLSKVSDLEERRGNVPFLNGGLFDLEDEYDQQDKVKIPNSAFAAILELFERFNFTVTESTPFDIEVAVDPEMLGKVFEELVTGRHESGSYYTPRPIVSFMCRESLKHYLTPRDGNEAAVARFVDEGDPSMLCNSEATLDALRTVKVCDPACGSGAYLLGMMQELLRLREALFKASGLDEANLYQRKLEIIQKNLYGVDIDLFAVNIAKLRLWLSLAVDFVGPKPPPLPNLDFKIECGDSLTAPDPQGIPDLYREILVRKADELAKLKADYLETYGAKKRKLGAQIHNEEAKLREALHEQVEDDAVDWRVAFAEVFRGGGFDIVLANPPYGILNKRQNQKLGHRVRPETIELIRNSNEFRPVLRGFVNVCNLFIRRSFSLLRPQGVFVEIFPLSFACDWSFGLLRAHVLRHHTIRDIEAFPERDDPKKRVFSSAKVSVCIMVATTGFRHGSRAFTLRINREPFVDVNIPVATIEPDELQSFDSSSSIPLVSPKDIESLKTIYSHSLRLSEIGDCYEGEVNLTSSRDFIRSERKYTPMHKGAIIGRYTIRDKMSQGEIEYVDATALLAEKGRDRNSKVWHYRQARIAMQGITGVNENIRLKMTFIAPGVFLGNSANYVLLKKPDEIEYLFVLAILNSEIANYVFKCFSTNSNVNGYEVDSLPIPRATAKEKQTLADLARRCLKANGKGCAAVEAEIDTVTRRLFGLSA